MRAGHPDRTRCRQPTVGASIRDADARRRARSLVRVTAAPIAPLDLLCAIGHVLLRRAGDAVRPRGAGRRRIKVRAAGRARGSGSRPRPGWRPATEHGRVVLGRRTPTWCRCRRRRRRRAGRRARAVGRGGLDGLTWRARLRPGERVVVLGGGGRGRPVGDRRRSGAGRPPGGRRLPQRAARPGRARGRRGVGGGAVPRRRRRPGRGAAGGHRRPGRCRHRSGVRCRPLQQYVSLV